MFIHSLLIAGLEGEWENWWLSAVWRSWISFGYIHTNRHTWYYLKELSQTKLRVQRRCSKCEAFCGCCCLERARICFGIAIRESIVSNSSNWVSEFYVHLYCTAQQTTSVCVVIDRKWLNLGSVWSGFVCMWMKNNDFVELGGRGEYCPFVVVVCACVIFNRIRLSYSD